MTKREIIRRLNAIDAALPFDAIYFEKEADQFDVHETISYAIEELSTSEIPNKCDVIPGRCKDCKYFEYDKVMMIGGIPLIVMHEYCGRWGEGVKSSENGFCFLFERKDGTVQRG